jgi:hypothetical protein
MPVHGKESVVTMLDLCAVGFQGSTLVVDISHSGLMSDQAVLPGSAASR